MNLEDIRAQLEQELTWRIDEMRILGNVLADLGSELDRQRYRKALLVMLYAHYKESCKRALSIYADAVNREHITCGDATPCIAASSLAFAFKDFENIQRKSQLFKKQLPDDTQLHRFCRRAELLQVLEDLEPAG